MKLNKYLLTVLILTLIGFIFRIWFLSSQSLWMDESFSINAALAILKHGYPLLDSGIIYGTGYLPHLYLTSFFISFLPDIFGARLVSVLFGTLTLILSFYLGKEYFDKKTALIFTFLMTFSVWEIAWSRQARMYMQLQFFYLLSLFFLSRFLDNKTSKNIFFLLLSTLFALLTHPFGFSLFLIYFISFIFNFKKFNLRSAFGEAFPKRF